jgi:hypothetical protein
MKKQLDVNPIANDLKGASLFFQRPPAQPPQPVQPEQPENQEPKKPVSQEPRKPGSRKPGKPETQKAGFPKSQEIGKPGKTDVTGDGFDINQAPVHKDTFLLTDPEFYALEDLKLTLKRQLGVKVIKDDLARCAFNLMLADYQAKGDESFVVRHLKAKKTK